MTQFASQGFVFTYDYIEQMNDGPIVYPGGWGCMRFTDVLPTQEFFTNPDTEYRKSASTGLWEANGTAVLSQMQLEGLHTYFVNLEKK